MRKGIRYLLAAMLLCTPAPLLAKGGGRGRAYSSKPAKADKAGRKAKHTGTAPKQSDSGITDCWSCAGGLAQKGKP